MGIDESPGKKDECGVFIYTPVLRLVGCISFEFAAKSKTYDSTVVHKNCGAKGVMKGWGARGFTSEPVFFTRIMGSKMRRSSCTFVLRAMKVGKQGCKLENLCLYHGNDLSYWGFSGKHYANFGKISAILEANEGPIHNSDKLPDSSTSINDLEAKNA
ncbi:hypothetical protein B9Z19DRAFT_1067090 [Tuber borchii]|uniref:Uncharacterized protein n=1 Tax=Tuber borchii TaxID=42251 RepID=A0A2T6ZK84_TUBBO|nr:hypothetical protein B9Z19DRAFT_1067090 [Tuber borchii]